MFAPTHQNPVMPSPTALSGLWFFRYWLINLFNSTEPALPKLMLYVLFGEALAHSDWLLVQLIWALCEPFKLVAHSNIAAKATPIDVFRDSRRPSAWAHCEPFAWNQLTTFNNRAITTKSNSTFTSERSFTNIWIVANPLVAPRDIIFIWLSAGRNIGQERVTRSLHWLPAVSRWTQKLNQTSPNKGRPLRQPRAGPSLLANR